MTNTAQRSTPILLVEDSEPDIDAFTLLSGELDPGLRLEVARTGDEAVTILRRGVSQPGGRRVLPFVILDLSLRDGTQSGMDVLHQLKADKATRRAPVVVYADAADPGAIE